MEISRFFGSPCEQLPPEHSGFRFLADFRDYDPFEVTGTDFIPIWDGWDAALIELKREVSDPGMPQLGKRKERDMQLSPARALDLGLWSVATEDATCSGELEKIAKSVAALTLQCLMHLDRPKLEDILSREVFEIVWQSAFSSVAQFVLSIFDLEDFERIYRDLELDKKGSKLYSKLHALKSEPCKPLISIIAEGKISAEEFSILREHDVGHILQVDLIDYEYFSGLPVFSWVFPLWPIALCEISRDDARLAFEEMQRYDVPLKEDQKMQLALELIHPKIFRVFDTLFVEALKGVKFKEFATYVSSKLDDEKLDDASEYVSHPEQFSMKPSELAKDELSKFVSGLRDGLFFLAYIKLSALRRSQVAATFPLSCGVLGSFSVEVHKVVQAANLERRMQGHRFINLQQILFGLSLSCLGNSVQGILTDEGIDCRIFENRLQVPLYNVYQKSEVLAMTFGREVVQLEHLVLAIFTVVQENYPGTAALAMWTSPCGVDKLWDVKLRETLMGRNTKHCPKSWKDEGLKEFLPQECLFEGRLMSGELAAVQRLYSAFEDGLKLPVIR